MKRSTKRRIKQCIGALPLIILNLFLIGFLIWVTYMITMSDIEAATVHTSDYTHECTEVSTEIITMTAEEVIEDTIEELETEVVSVNYETIEEETSPVVEEVFMIPLYKMVWDGHEVFMREELQIHTYNLCVKYNIPWFYEYYLAQMFQESGWKEGIVTPRGDYGIAQINKVSHAYLSERLGIYDFADSFNSISGGVYLMQEYINKGYTVRQAMTAYRWGEAHALSPDPEGYYDRIAAFTTGLCRIN